MFTVTDKITANQIARAITSFHKGERIERRGMNQATKAYLRVFITPGCNGLDIVEIPDETLKVFFDQMVAECGYNSVLLRESKVWLGLNIYPAKKHLHTNADLKAMEEFFMRLDQAGYIWFSNAGSVWRIEAKQS